MAAKFNIVAELSLRGPKNLGPLVKNIQRQLQSVNIPVNVQVDAQAQRALNQVNQALKGTKKAAQGIGSTSTIAASNLAQMGSSSQKTANQISKVNQQSQNAQKNIKTVGDQAAVAGNKMRLFGEQAGLAVKRFAAFSIPTGIMIGFTTALRNGLKEAIDFERELVKIAQVSGRTVNSLKGLTKEITRLATTFGVSSQELLETSRILAQTGLSARDTQQALAALAKASLAPTFKDMNDTVEASIAAMRQFGISAGQLESKLGAINAVAGSFAVEAADISFAIRRTGGAFKAAGGQLEELIALFTSVRSTTRESAETIATGFRTIFTRIQRPQTIAYLRELGIELQNAAGQFVGPMEAVKRLNAALANVPTTDPRFSQIVEQIGGYRQVSKVIPMITKYNEAVRAYIVAQSGATSLAEDAQKAQGTLAVQIQKTKEEFSAFMRNMTQDDSIKSFAQNALQLARAFIRVADAAKSMIPMLASIVAFRGAFAAMQFGRGFVSGLANFGGQGGLGGQLGRRVGGGPAAGGGGVGVAVGGGGRGPAGNQALTRNTAALTSLTSPITNLNTSVRSLVPTIAPLTQAVNNLTARIGAMGVGAVGGTRRTRSRVPAGPMKQQMLPGFARGGVVPGQGTGDSVPAMLTPGEFVIKRSSAKNIGYSKLASMNKYAAGGKVRYIGQVGLLSRGGAENDKTFLPGSKKAVVTATDRGKINSHLATIIKSSATKHVKTKGARKNSAIESAVQAFGKTVQYTGGIDADYFTKSSKFVSDFEKPMKDAVKKGITKLNQAIPPKTGRKLKADNMAKKMDLGSGAVFESFIKGMVGQKDPGSRTFDIEGKERSALQQSKLTKSGGIPKNTDIKLNLGPHSISSVIRKGFVKKGASVPTVDEHMINVVKTNKYARGGSVGSDTVPAMLTPGEFVVNAKSASRIGYGNLHAMNKGGRIRGYAKGGKVQRFNTGGEAGGGTGALALAFILPTIVAQFQAAGEEASNLTKGFADFLSKMTMAVIVLSMLPKKLGMGTGGLGAIQPGAFASGVFGGSNTGITKAQPLSKVGFGAGVYGPGAHSKIDWNKRAAYEKGQAMRGQVLGAGGALMGAAASAMFNVMAENSKKASQATIEGAKSMKDAATAIQQADRASRMQRAGTGAMGGGMAAMMLMPLITNPIGAIAAGIGLVAAGAGIGAATGGQTPEEKRAITQSIRKNLVSNVTDSLRDSIGDIEAKRATFESKSLTIRTKMLKTEALLDDAHGKDREELQRQLRGNISDYYNIGNRLSSTAKNIDEFKDASGGLGAILIRQIAAIRGIPVEEVEQQFTDLIEAQNNSRETQIKLVAATRQVIKTFNQFSVLARNLNRSASSLSKFARSIDRTTSILFGETTQTEFDPSPEFNELKSVDFSNLSPSFTGALAAMTIPFGQAGADMRQQSKYMADAFRQLPQILADARSRTIAESGEFGSILEEMLGTKFGPELTKLILSSIQSSIDKAGTGGQSGLLGKIEEDAKGFAEGILGEPAKRLSAAVGELAKATEQQARALIELNNARLNAELKFLSEGITLQKRRRDQERTIDSLSGKTVDNVAREQALEDSILAMARLAKVNRDPNDPRGLKDIRTRLLANRKATAEAEARVSGMSQAELDSPEGKAAMESLNRLKTEGLALTEVFNRLHDAGDQHIEALKRRIDIERQAAQQLQRGALSYGFGTDEQRQQMDIGARIAMSGMKLQDVPSKYRGAVQGVYRSLSDVQLGGFGTVSAKEREIFEGRGAFKGLNIGKIGLRSTAVDPKTGKGDFALGQQRTGRAKELFDLFNYLKSKGFDERRAATIAYAGATSKEEQLINSLQGYLQKQNDSLTEFLKELRKIVISDIRKREDEIREQKKNREERVKAIEERDKVSAEKRKLEEDTVKDRKAIANLDALEKKLLTSLGPALLYSARDAKGNQPLLDRFGENISDKDMLVINKHMASLAQQKKAADEASKKAYGKFTEDVGMPKVPRARDQEYINIEGKKRLYTTDMMLRLVAANREGNTQQILDEGSYTELAGVSRQIGKDSESRLIAGLREHGYSSGSDFIKRPEAGDVQGAKEVIKAEAVRYANELQERLGLSNAQRDKIRDDFIDHYKEKILTEDGRNFRVIRVSTGAADLYGNEQFESVRPDISGGYIQSPADIEQSVVAGGKQEMDAAAEARKRYQETRAALAFDLFGKDITQPGQRLTSDENAILDRIASTAQANADLLAFSGQLHDVSEFGLGILRDELESATEKIEDFSIQIEELNKKIAALTILSSDKGKGQTLTGLMGLPELEADVGTSVAGKHPEGSYYNPKTNSFIKVDKKGNVIPFAKGGKINSKDTIPAMLAPGEAVLNPSQLRNLNLDDETLKAAGVPILGAAGGIATGNLGQRRRKPVDIDMGGTYAKIMTDESSQLRSISIEELEKSTHRNTLLQNILDAIKEQTSFNIDNLRVINATIAQNPINLADKIKGIIGPHQNNQGRAIKLEGFAGGGSIFKPKGTDTVPAMLTPGEFVIKKSSVDKYGSGMLSAINEGYYARGGRVGKRRGMSSEIADKQAAVEERQRNEDFWKDSDEWQNILAGKRSPFTRPERYEKGSQMEAEARSAQMRRLYDWAKSGSQPQAQSDTVLRWLESQGYIHEKGRVRARDFRPEFGVQPLRNIVRARRQNVAQGTTLRDMRRKRRGYADGGPVYMRRGGGDFKRTRGGGLFQRRKWEQQQQLEQQQLAPQVSPETTPVPETAPAPQLAAPPSQGSEMQKRLYESGMRELGKNNDFAKSQFLQAWNLGKDTYYGKLAQAKVQAMSTRPKAPEGDKAEHLKRRSYVDPEVGGMSNDELKQAAQSDMDAHKWERAISRYHRHWQLTSDRDSAFKFANLQGKFDRGELGPKPEGRAYVDPEAAGMSDADLKRAALRDMGYGLTEEERKTHKRNIERAISRFRLHYQRTDDRDSRYKFLQLQKNIEEDKKRAEFEANRPKPAPGEPRFPPRRGPDGSAFGGPDQQPSSQKPSTTLHDEYIKNRGLGVPDDPARDPTRPIPNWMRQEMHMGKWLMEEASRAHFIAEKLHPENMARQKKFTDAIDRQASLFFLGGEEANGGPVGYEGWLGKYGSNKVRQLMSKAFGDDINEFGFGNFEGLSKDEVNKIWSNTDKHSDARVQAFLQRGKWGGQKHQEARLKWWEFEWNAALKNWSHQTGVDVRRPQDVEAEFREHQARQAKRHLRGKAQYDFFDAMAKYGTVVHKAKGGNLLYNFAVERALGKLSIGDHRKAGYSSDRLSTLEQWIKYMDTMQAMVEHPTDPASDLIKSEDTSSALQDAGWTDYTDPKITTNVQGANAFRNALWAQKFDTGGYALYRGRMSDLAEMEWSKKGQLFPRMQKIWSEQYKLIFNRLGVIPKVADIPTAQDPTRPYANPEFTEEDVKRAEWRPPLTHDDGTPIMVDLRSEATKRREAQEQRQEAYKRASGGVSDVTATIKREGNRLLYQDASSVGHFMKGLRYGVVQHDPRRDNKQDLDYKLFGMMGNNLSDPFGSTSSLKKQWDDFLKNGTYNKDTKLGWHRGTGGTHISPLGLAGVEGLGAGASFAQHVITELGLKRWAKVKKIDGETPQEIISNMGGGLQAMVTKGAKSGDDRFKYLKSRVRGYTKWSDATGQYNTMALPHQYRQGWVNFLKDDGSHKAVAMSALSSGDVKDLNDILRITGYAEDIQKHRSFADYKRTGGSINPWATNPMMLQMIMQMYGNMPSGFRGVSRGMVKGPGYYEEVDDKDAFIDPLTGHKTIHKGKIARREAYFGGKNTRMVNAMRGRMPMMSRGRTKSGVPKSQRMPLLETLDKYVSGNATPIQQQVFRGMHVDYGKGEKFNTARRALLKRRVEASFERLLQAGLFTSAGSIENLNLTRDNASWVYRLLKKGPMSPDMAEIRTAYRRIINYKGDLGKQQPSKSNKPSGTSTGIPAYQGRGTSEVLRPGDDGWPAKGPEPSVDERLARAITRASVDSGLPKKQRINVADLAEAARILSPDDPSAADKLTKAPPHVPTEENPLWAPDGGWQLTMADRELQYKFYKLRQTMGVQELADKYPEIANGINAANDRADADWWAAAPYYNKHVNTHPEGAIVVGQLSRWVRSQRGYAGGGRVLGFNDGGSVPGAGNTDSIPAMLTPGEYVVNAQAAGRHAALLRAINSGTAEGFHDGGRVGGGRQSQGNGGFESAATKIKDAMANIPALAAAFSSFTEAANMITNALSGFSFGSMQHEHTHTFTGTVNFDIVGADIADELQDRLNSIGQEMAKAQVISVLERMAGGEAPATIAGDIRNGGTNA